ncbi:uncharacterized protein ACIQIH_004086 isoform 2-T2 [Cyanocitta cristata]
MGVAPGPASPAAAAVSSPAPPLPPPLPPPVEASPCPARPAGPALPRPLAVRGGRSGARRDPRRLPALDGVAAISPGKKRSRLLLPSPDPLPPPPFYPLAQPWEMGAGAEDGRLRKASAARCLPGELDTWLHLSSLPSSALGLAGAAPHSLLPPCVRVCKRLPLLLAAAAAASRPTFSPPRSVSGEDTPLLHPHPIPHTAAPCVPTATSARLGWICTGVTRPFQLVCASLVGLHWGLTLITVPLVC